MIRRGTWLALLVLLALIGFSFYLRDRQAKELAAATPTQGMAPLFDGSEGDPTLIRVENAAGDAVQISRDQSGAWVLNSPEETEADQAAAEAAATQVGALRVLSTVQLAADIIGLDKPQYTISIEVASAVKHKLLVGSVTPIQDGYYSQLDGGAYQVVDKTGLEALIGLLAKPPYLSTPTPEATITSAASATPQADGGNPSPSAIEPTGAATIEASPTAVQ